MPFIKVRDDLCKGCKLCITFCPKQVIRMSDRLNPKGYYVAELFDKEGCTGCGICARMCPDVAISVYREDKKEVPA
ncbi:MAG: ferredoxin family protein [Candidatus Eremiobacteraeota bacterium]|nr:ferredoxin family protein [Candidatus Eremiobacteraeota bacterium]